MCDNKTQLHSSGPFWRKTTCVETCSEMSAADITHKISGDIKLGSNKTTPVTIIIRKGAAALLPITTSKLTNTQINLNVKLGSKSIKEVKVI